ncbi:molybdopterin molybdotransferase MoeA [Sphingomonas sp. BGYR3]|uniref:molybdopterin molybdotransferase MoeA n=1 Tax=Sphingomonas sp. BGYR3 TaxID=2975483 RepID=UPI0021A6C48A|nr:molybdopterin molybdotransferase MoeA [Sphingomonas sp. BGYR3]MDG5487866.1 molybdopterin molybdotransferase MoeA [Sphingomonas sp. BGYR3]
MAPPLLPLADAQARLIGMAVPVAAEALPIAGCAGRWAAEPVTALRTQPASDLSVMDGYAIAHAALPGPWTVIGESAAGRPHAGPVGPGQAVRIFTGAVMPAGADCVLVQEEAARDGDRLILTGAGPAAPGRNVRHRGLDFAAGTDLIRAGERMTPARLAMAAMAGHGTLTVRRPVRVAVAATGDELCPPGTPVGDGQIPETNRLMLAAMLADLPVELIDLGILPDDLDALTRAFADVDTDLLVTSGGASVGDHDLVRPALAAAGWSIDFWRVALRPGKPVMAGRRGDALVLGLPGNPVSVFATTMLFVRPAIAALGGSVDPLPRLTPAILAEPLPANGERTDFLRAAILPDGRVSAAAVQDSSMLLTLARASCLIHRPAHAPAAAVGDPVDILVIA